MKRLLFIMSLISITFPSCEKWNESYYDGSTCCGAYLTVNFTQTVNGVELTTNNMIYTNEAGENYDVKTLKYIISNIMIHGLWDDNGSGDPHPLTFSKKIKDIHFIDISDESTFSFTVSTPGNRWTSISYTMGLDTIQNINNLYINESYHSAMAWPETNGGGYHYMKLEGSYNNDSTFYNTHTGGTMGNDYSFHNADNISLTVDDDLGNVSINVDMDINNWYNSPQIEFSSYGMGIMMNMPMQMNIQMNGMTDVFSVDVSK